MNIKTTIVAFVAVLLTGCVTTTVSVIDRRAVAQPFSRVLCFYLPEGCDFSLFDSTLYNICLRNHDLRDSGYVERGNQESAIAEKLSTARTSVMVSSYVLDSAHSSYNDFLHYVDSMKVDALLIVGVIGYQHEEQVEFIQGAPPAPPNAHSPGYPGSPGVTRTVKVINGNFSCDLFATNSLVRPVWRAAIGEKGHPRSTKGGLTDKLVQQVVESLKNSQYIAH